MGGSGGRQVVGPDDLRGLSNLTDSVIALLQYPASSPLISDISVICEAWLAKKVKKRKMVL